MELNQDIFEEFKALSKKDIQSFFVKALIFFTGPYTELSNYYSGKSTAISSEPYKQLEELEKEVQELFQIFHSLGEQLNSYKWWLLLEEIEEIDNRLKTTRNINKWSRSTATSVNYSPQQEIDYTTKQKDTIEKIASSLGGSSLPEDDWALIAKRNNLTEEDYDVEGGKSLKIVPIRNGINSFTINAVADVISEQTINGKDILQALTIEEEDLKTVTDIKCSEQAVNILIQLKKQDNPDAPNGGIQKEIVVGVNRASFNFPIINRQLRETFSTDDSLKNFSVIGLKLEEDNLQIDYQVETRLGDLIQKNSVI